MQTNDKALLRVEEAAEYLGLSRNTLNFWRAHDRGPSFVKMGRNVLYRVSDLEAWISENTRTPAGTIG